MKTDRFNVPLHYFSLCTLLICQAICVVEVELP